MLSTIESYTSSCIIKIGQICKANLIKIEKAKTLCINVPVMTTFGIIFPSRFTAATIQVNKLKEYI